MARERFQQLLKFIHFADNETADQHDRLYKLRPLMEKLRKNFRGLQILDEMQAIYLAMIKFRGRLLFRQYTPGKSSQCGIKLFKICNPDEVRTLVVNNYAITQMLRVLQNCFIKNSSGLKDKKKT